MSELPNYSQIHEELEKQRLARLPSIERLNSTPMESLRFMDFASLKVPGRRDQFTALRSAALRSRIEPSIYDQIAERFDGDLKSVDATIRWILRSNK